MYREQQINQIFTFLNAIEIFAIAVILYMAVAFQFILHELPCPLCLLQRVGLFGVAISLIMNLKSGFRPSHYAYALLFAMFTSFVALRQIALHVVPGTGAYGAPFLGLHLYSWVFVICVLICIYSVIILGCDFQYSRYQFKPKPWQTLVAQVLIVLLLILVIVNLVTVFMECGLSQCPDNPVHYLF